MLPPTPTSTSRRSPAAQAKEERLVLGKLRFVRLVASSVVVSRVIASSVAWTVEPSLLMTLTTRVRKRSSLPAVSEPWNCADGPPPTPMVRRQRIEIGGSARDHHVWRHQACTRSSPTLASGI
jgi:hypothetical protein